MKSLRIALFALTIVTATQASAWTVVPQCVKNAYNACTLANAKKHKGKVITATAALIGAAVLVWKRDAVKAQLVKLSETDRAKAVAKYVADKYASISARFGKKAAEAVVTPEDVVNPEVVAKFQKALVPLAATVNPEVASQVAEAVASNSTVSETVIQEFGKAVEKAVEKSMDRVASEAVAPALEKAADAIVPTIVSNPAGTMTLSLLQPSKTVFTLSK